MDKINKENQTGFTVYDLEMRRMDREEEEKRKRQLFYRENKGKLIALALSLLTLFCLFNFGFFRTIGIWIVMVVGYSIGAYFDRDVKYINFLRRLFR
ncbi:MULTISPECIES: DUF2273 domain-containing protein [Anaerococcus]|uniref:DUF2273 domain-containing protein n=1 Tax=Anaerococcus prevotii ACS-065-V-Col13 TaxID=879305 RepID=F0GTE9_9FIRM|nr:MULTISPECIES: DUF2273 domain-containing protein [Anaerococcus]EGC82885.1 hypothetical protein HMPREF9290_0993 [Anaerococcus prevotii ACS-065-V-Col13]